jgi:outer membrane protein
MTMEWIRGRLRLSWLAPSLMLILPLAPPTGAGTTALEAQDRPITLEQAVERALAESPQIRDAELEVRVAEERVGQTRGSLLPRVDLTVRYTRNLRAPAVFLPTILFDPDAPPDELFPVPLGLDNVWTSALVAEQPLFDGRAFTALRASSRFLSLQDEVARGRAHDLVTRVRLAYYELLLREEEERLTEGSLERVRHSLTITRSLREEGLASEYDELRLEVEEANLESALLRVRNARRESARELAVVLGMEGGDLETLVTVGSLADLELDEPGGNTPENRALLEFMGFDPAAGEGEVRAAAREGRSELRQLDLEGDLRRAELRSEQADYLPRVSLFGNYDIQVQQDGSPRFFGESGERAYGRTVGVLVTVPIFSGLQRRARVNEVRARLRQAEVRRTAEEERTDARIRSALEQVEEARGRARGQRRAVERAERGRAMVEARFAEGLASQLELTDAEVALRESRLGYAEAVYSYLAARARVDVLTGQVPGVP